MRSRPAATGNRSTSTTTASQPNRRTTTTSRCLDCDGILDAALDVARRTGVEMVPTCASAVSGARKPADKGEFGPNDTVVVLNTGARNKDADVLRAHLGSRRASGE